MRVIDPPIESDELGAALLKSLSRFIGLGLSWPAWLTFIVGVLSLGIVPLVWQTRRFLHHAAVERTQWRHIAEWLESATGQSMERIRVTTEQQRPPIGIVVVIGASLVVAAASFGLLLAAGGEGIWQNLVTISGWFAKRPGATWGILYTISLTIGYALYYMLVLRHGARMRALIEDFNDLAVDAVAPPDEDLGLHGPWLIGAIAFALAGLPWGVLMMLAGGVQRRYTTTTSVLTRVAIAERLQEIRDERQAG